MFLLFLLPHRRDISVDSPTFLLGPAVSPLQFFHSRIATGHRSGVSESIAIYLTGKLVSCI